MLRIGEFSRLSMVPVSALRYYDEIGLLKPAEVDRFTGYRYYSALQLPRLNRVNALKDFGLNLADIIRLTGEPQQDAGLRMALQDRADAIRHSIADEMARLKRLETWLEHLDRKEGEMEATTYDVVIKKVEPILAVCLRRVVPHYESEGELWSELCTYLAGQKTIHYAGPPLTLFHDCEYREANVDIELAVPVAAPVNESGDIKVRTISGHEQIVAVIHKGPFNTVNNAYQFLLRWMEKNGYRMVGPDRVVYLNSPQEVPPADLLQELQIPVERA